MTGMHVMGLYLVLGVAFAIGAIIGLRMARRKQEWLSPLRAWHGVLVYLWVAGVLAAYPSFMAEHPQLPFLRFPLIMMTITIVVTLVSSVVWCWAWCWVSFAAGRVADIRNQHKANY